MRPIRSPFPAGFTTTLVLALGIGLGSAGWAEAAGGTAPEGPPEAPPPLDPAARAAGADDGWWQTVTAQLAREEYRATSTPDGFRAANRAQALRTYFGERGIEVVPREAGDAVPAWRFAWDTTRFGRPGALRAVGAADPEPNGSRVTYRRSGLDEWYDNSPEGLEQGFTVHAPPPGEGPLCIVGRIGGALRAQLSVENGAVDLLDEHGARVLRYGELHVWDARGTELPSRLELADAELRIVVQDDGAAYPLTIDPLMTTPAWEVGSFQAGAALGATVATAGDVNGDGYSDVIIGAGQYDIILSDEGRVWVYHGSASGLSIFADWTAESAQADARFGSRVATAGDVNGDGYSDVLVGANLFDNGETDEGRAFLYLGSSTGLATTAAWTAESDQANALFGHSLATAGDVNGDGYSDVIVGAYSFTGGLQTDEGQAYVYHGSPSGLGTTPVWTKQGNQVGAWFGGAVKTAGDVNGDGYSDVIVGALAYDNPEMQEGRVSCFHGSATGLSTVAAWTAEADYDGANFGVAVDTAGDVNGDGYSDVIVGATFYDDGEAHEGWAFVYHGSSAGLSTAADWTADSDQVSAWFGYSVATAGDVNGDGYSDVVVGARYYDSFFTDEGGAFVYHGSAAGLGAGPAWTVTGQQADAWFGVPAATAGDVNGDGFSDLIVGAPSYDFQQTDEGRAFVYHGSAAGLATVAGWVEASGQSGARFGLSTASAGDVNGDGYADVIVGAHLYSNGQSGEGRAFVFHGSATGPSTTADWTAESDQVGANFGASVATAGDVNGDGYSDVIVGSYFYDNGQTDEGRAFVYHGSSGGLSATPSWTAESDQAGAEFGISVATAGDVNGDGYSDVIVGSYLYDNGQTSEGRAFAYHGSAAGLSPTAVWMVESNQTNAELGWSVGTAGDVNGDGFSDVIVGIYGYDNGQFDEGRALVYHGSGAGLSATADWTVESNQVSAWFGIAVATAGDVDGDGYSDVVVGASKYSNGQTGEGRAFVFRGSGTGLGTTAAWTAESNQADANFGSWVGTAGDVNGDGFSEVIVGAYLYDNGQGDEGRAFAYHGSASGLSTTAAWTAESDQGLAHFGVSATTAGDVNGDGYSDVIVGSDFYDDTFTNDGRAYIYYGNGGAGRTAELRQLHTNGTTPIAVLGQSDSGTGFRIGATMNSSYGRTRLQMEHEVKPLGAPFDALNTVTGAYSDIGADGVVEMDQLVSGLLPDTPYHWRVRAKYDLAKTPFQRNGPWIHFGSNGGNEADLRTGDVTVVGAPPEEWPGADAGFELSAAGPNPARGRSDVLLALGERTRVDADVLDVSGRRVAALVQGEVYEPGSHVLTWDGRDRSGSAAAAGIYFLRVRGDGETRVHRAVLLR